MHVAVSQQVVIEPHTGERRDALDQRWTSFLQACGLTPVLIPNHVETARQLMQLGSICGVLLTGGNDLTAYGGDVPERDATEEFLVVEAERTERPVLGVCRGMQFLQHRAGVPLHRVPGHVGVRHQLQLPDGPADVNTFHNWAALTTVPELEVYAAAEDGVIESVMDRRRRTAGIMWHPEREPHYSPRDVAFFRRWLTGSEA